MFASSILKIEGDNVTTAETVHQLNELEVTLKQRQEDDFLSPPAASEKDFLVEDGYNGDEISAVCSEFYGE